MKLHEQTFGEGLLLQDAERAKQNRKRCCCCCFCCCFVLFLSKLTLCKSPNDECVGAQSHH